MSGSRAAASTRTVVTASVLPLPADDLLARLRRSDSLRYVCWPLLAFPPDLPPTLAVGSTATIRLALFGLVPLWTHSVSVVAEDGGGFVTVEHGGPLRSWRHRLTVEPVDAGHAFYRDEVVLDAGRSGAVLAPAVRVLYRWRHRRWAKLARS